MIGSAEEIKERYKTDRDNWNYTEILGRRGRRPLHKCDRK